MTAKEGVDLKTTARWGIATLGMLGLLACGSQSSNYPPGAVLSVDPSSLTYMPSDGGAFEPSLAAYVGTSQTLTIDLQDHGQAPLTIKSVTLTDPGGGFQLIPPTPAGPDGTMITTVNSHPQSPADAFVGFYFTPTKAGPYSATINVSTNATANGGLTTIPITALGVAPDGGQE
jgi:hypothetical protein